MYKIDRPFSGWFDGEESLEPDLSVDGPKHIDTGLVDQDGHRIFRTQPPIGFGRDKEWS